MSGNERESAMDATPVTIREAFDSLDEYLIEQDRDFDVSAGLDDLKARIDRQTASQSDHVDHLARRDPASLRRRARKSAPQVSSVAPQLEHQMMARRMVLDLTDRRETVRQRERLVMVTAITSFSVLAGILLAVAQLSLVAVVGLVVVVIALVTAMTLISRWSTLADREFLARVVQDNREEHRKVGAPEDHQQQVLERSLTAGDTPRPGPAVTIHNFEGNLHLEGHRGSRNFSALGWVAFIATFGAATWSAIEGVTAPLFGLLGLLGVAMAGIPVLMFGIASISSEARRNSAEKILTIVLGRVKPSGRRVSSAGTGGRRRSTGDWEETASLDSLTRDT